MSEPKDGGPAFPCNSPDGMETYKGMSLRDYFAAKMLPTIYPDYHKLDQIAEQCYDMADAMLKAREG